MELTKSIDFLELSLDVVVLGHQSIGELGHWERIKHLPIFLRPRPPQRIRQCLGCNRRKGKGRGYRIVFSGFPQVSKALLKCLNSLMRLLVSTPGAWNSRMRRH